MRGLASRLTQRVTVWERERERTNAIGETEFGYRPARTVWAEITPVSAAERTTPGEESYIAATHKITVRTPCPLTADAYLTCGGKRFDVVSWEPHYRHRDCIVITAKEVLGRSGDPGHRA